MDESAIKRLALILSVWAEVESMKAENSEREMRNESLAWNGEHFQEKAEELKHLAHVHNDQLGI